MNETTHTTAPADPATGEDEVTKLFRRMYDAHDRDERYSSGWFDATQTADISAKSYFEGASQHAIDEYFALQGALPFLKATTSTGAAIQIDQALSLVAGMLDDVDETQREKLEQRFRAVKRLLFSALDVVDGLSSLKLRDIHRDAWSPCLNPWIPVEQRIEMARAGR